MSDLRVSAETLMRASDESLCWEVIQPAWALVNFYDGPAILAQSLAPLTRGQRALIAVHWCCSEILNGGVHQFLTNPTGLLAEEAIAGFDAIGVPDAAVAITAGIRMLSAVASASDPLAPESDDFEQAEAFDRLRAEFDRLDDPLFGLIETVIYPRAAAFVRAHPEDFVR